MVDVVVTVDGRSRQTIRGIRDGGGLVGVRSSVRRRPDPFQLEFVDWPFLEDLRTGGFSVEQHVDVVREASPRYAVAPDVQPPRELDEVLAVADRLSEFANTVIVVPKTVSPAQVPDRFRVGIPFRDEFGTNLFINTYDDFRGLDEVHILGGNPNGQILLAEQFDLDVGSIDTPKPVRWADFGRVFIGAGGSGVEIDKLNPGIVEVIANPRILENPELRATEDVTLNTGRGERIRFSVQNMVQAWNRGGITYRWLEAVAPGRGPPPVPDRDSGLLGPAETFEERERMRERFEAAAEERVEERDVDALEREVRQTTLGDIPEEILAEEVDEEDLDRSQQAAIRDFLEGNDNGNGVA